MEKTVSEFVADLHRLSEYCQFTTLDGMLRDRLVCGIRDRRLQQCLLAETDLTFRKALDISQAIEAAERNARDLQAKQTPKLILTLNQQTRPPYSQGRPKSSDNQTKCYRCGSSHQARECPFKDAECITANGRDTLLRCVIPRLGMKEIRWLIKLTKSLRP